MASSLCAAWSLGCVGPGCRPATVLASRGRRLTDWACPVLRQKMLPRSGVPCVTIREERCRGEAVNQERGPRKEYLAGTAPLLVRVVLLLARPPPLCLFLSKGRVPVTTAGTGDRDLRVSPQGLK